MEAGYLRTLNMLKCYLPMQRKVAKGFSPSSLSLQPFTLLLTLIIHCVLEKNVVYYILMTT